MTNLWYKNGAIAVGMNLLFTSEGWPRQKAAVEILTEAPFDPGEHEAVSSYVKGPNSYSKAAGVRAAAIRERIEAAQADRELCKGLRAEPVEEAIQRPVEPLPKGSIPCGVYSIDGFHHLKTEPPHPRAWETFARVGLPGPVAIASPPQPSAESERIRKMTVAEYQEFHREARAEAKAYLERRRESHPQEHISNA